MTEKYEQIIERIKEADMVLVGIGEEFEENFQQMPEKEVYAELLNKAGKKENERSLKEFIKSQYLMERENTSTIEAYKILETLLTDKNYFIISTCKDNYIMNTNLKKDRIVTPCGNYQYMQCEKNCTDSLMEAEAYTRSVIKQLRDDTEKVEIPKCEHCGAELVFNNIMAENYNENGYMQQWELYTKWLQGTLNRKVCILELGVGMKYPTVIRWPFEKVAFFNQKASFYRVHARLYQLSEEIKVRGISIKENAVSFLENLCEKGFLIK